MAVFRHFHYRYFWRKCYGNPNIQGSECYSLGDYRCRYVQYKCDPDLQTAHANAPWFVTFDDHEVVNDNADQARQAQVA